MKHLKTLCQSVQPILLACGLALGCVALSSQAQTFPNKSLTLVVPFSAGGGVDGIARLLAERLQGKLGQAVIVDNKPGASGMLGATAVARAKPDGYTLLLGSAGETAINPLIYKGRMQYQPEKDFAPITLVVKVPNVLVINPALAIKSVDELISFGKKNPGKLSYATSGVGNPQHLNGELLGALAGLQMNHVPYKGASNQLVDVASGNVDMTFVSLAGAAPFIKSQRVKAIGVTSAKRATFAPELPALSETGVLASYDLENWFGLFAPAGTPDAVLRQLNSAVQDLLKDPEMIKKLQAQGGEPSPMSAPQFKQFITGETAKYKRIVDAAHITAE